MQTEEPNSRIAYKILTTPQWNDWLKTSLFSGAGVDVEDGYIHLSAADQVAATYDRYFKDKVEDDVVLLEIDLSKVTAPIKWEPSRGGALFPHVYGSIPRIAVVNLVEGINAGNQAALEQFRSLSA